MLLKCTYDSAINKTQESSGTDVDETGNLLIHLMNNCSHFRLSVINLVGQLSRLNEYHVTGRRLIEQWCYDQIYTPRILGQSLKIARKN